MVYAPDLLGAVLRLLLVSLAAVVNVLGINVVGVGAGILTVLVTAPIAALTAAEAVGPPSYRHLFSDVYDAPCWIQEKQRKELRDHLDRYEDHYKLTPAQRDGL